VHPNNPGLSVDAGELSRLQQLIIRPGEGGGIITQTEFMFSKFCAEEKLKTKHLNIPDYQWMLENCHDCSS
jgi:hypothetical protein